LKGTDKRGLEGTQPLRASLDQNQNNAERILLLGAQGSLSGLVCDAVVVLKLEFVGLTEA
jgi:hypothetical protein